MATLYRQYRPQKFAELVGQDHITDILKRAIEGDKLTHAYLFYGPRGTGKTTTARLLAKRVNCQKPIAAEPCGKCDSCQALVKGAHVDVIEIDAASNRGIDDIRALRDRVSLVPAMGSYKIYIIDEVHMLTREAATALLKTLEEPAEKVLFVLATTELHKVLPTILSRCQVFRFRRATPEAMKGRLETLLRKEKRQAEAAAIEFVIDRADGCYRDAESMLGQALTLQAGELKQDVLVEWLGLPPREMLENFLAALLAGESGSAVAVIDQAYGEGYDLDQWLQESIRSARDKALANNADMARWSQIVRVLLQALQDLAYVPEPMIALHLAILTVCSTTGKTPKEEVVPEVKQPARTAAPERPVPAVARPATKVVKTSANGASQVVAVWDRLITGIKENNPVASTFLRAVEPITWSDGVVTMRANFSLHKTFFDKPENKKLVGEKLGELLNTTLGVACVLDEEGSQKAPSLHEMRAKREKEFSQTVKEVFEV